MAEPPPQRRACVLRPPVVLSPDRLFDSRLIARVAAAQEHDDHDIYDGYAPSEDHLSKSACLRAWRRATTARPVMLRDPDRDASANSSNPVRRIASLQASAPAWASSPRWETARRERRRRACPSRSSRIRTRTRSRRTQRAPPAPPPTGRRSRLARSRTTVSAHHPPSPRGAAQRSAAPRRAARAPHQPSSTPTQHNTTTARRPAHRPGVGGSGGRRVNAMRRCDAG